MTLKVENAIISKATIGLDEHGLLTLFLQLKMGGCSQGFGGYNLVGKHDIGGRFVRRILEVVGVRSLEELQGRYVKIRGSQVEIDAIGNIIEDKWFCPREEIAKWQKDDMLNFTRRV